MYEHIDRMVVVGGIEDELFLQVQKAGHLHHSLPSDGSFVSSVWDCLSGSGSRCTRYTELTDQLY